MSSAERAAEGVPPTINSSAKRKIKNLAKIDFILTIIIFANPKQDLQNGHYKCHIVLVKYVKIGLKPS